jgi:nucleoside-diphosphate-sugar epimerase
LGRYLIEDLLGVYDEVRVLARTPSKLEPQVGLTVVKGDITQPEMLNEDFLGGVDCLFHAAAKVGSWPRDPNAGYRQTNIEGTENVLVQAEKFGIPKMVYTSSFFALGATGSVPRDESWDNPPSFKHPYVTTKYQAGQLVDQMISDHSYPIIQVNPTTIMGAGIDNVISNTIIDWVNGKLPGLPGGGKTQLNFVRAQDVAIGHLLAAERGKIGEKYILGGPNMSLAEFMRLFQQKLGISVPRSLPYIFGKIYGLLQELQGDPSFTRADISVSQRFFIYSTEKARTELGYDPQPLESIIDPMLKFFVQSNKLNSRGEERVNNYFSTNL